MHWTHMCWRTSLLLTIIAVFGVVLGEGLLMVKAGSPNRNSTSSIPSKRSTFMLFRLIGNNMPPLQSPGQLLWNTEYALKHEGQFPDCQKRWVINQIVNITEKDLIVDLLKLYGYGGEDILISELDYSKLAATGDLEAAVTAQNSGRNAAIQNGKAAGATWILPLDGNHFITNQAWRRIVRSAKWSLRAGHHYFKVPMFRVAERQAAIWLNSSTTFETAFRYAPLKGESQIAFRNTARQHFPEGIRYGKRNKWNFIKEVCPYDSKASGICGCSDVFDEKIERESNTSRAFNVKVAALCGYSLRLWMFPTEGVNGKSSIIDWSYRGRLREEATKSLMHLVSQELRTLRNKRNTTSNVFH